MDFCSLLMEIKNLSSTSKNGIGVSMRNCVWRVRRWRGGDGVRKGRGPE